MFSVRQGYRMAKGPTKNREITRPVKFRAAAMHARVVPQQMTRMGM